MLVAIKTETRKRTQQKHRTITENVKNDPKMGARTRSFLGHLAPFFCARQPWEPKWLPRSPPRAPKTSPSLDFHWFWTIFWRFLYHVGYFLSGLPHYFFGYLELSFSNFWPQVQMCWGRAQGSVRSQKKCDVAHLLSSLPLCFCYLEPYFSSFWP